MISIRYVPKQVNANTTYYAVDKAVKATILADLNRLKSLLDQLKVVCDDELLEVRKHFFNPNPNIPKRAQPPYGYNNIYTFVDGVIDNFTIGTQRDISYKTAEGLVEVFKVAHEHLNGFEEIEFVDRATKIVDLNPHKSSATGSTFLNFFEVK